MRITGSTYHDPSLVPLTVIGGPEGAGKTTLIHHLITHAAGRHVVAVLPDLESIDPSAIVSRDGVFVRLRGGCTCVVTEDDCAQILAALTHGPTRPDHVLVEVPGRNSTRRSNGYGYMPGYRSDGTIIVVDVATVISASRTMDDSLYQRIRVADVVVLNKLDLAGANDAAIAQECLEWLLPAVRIIWSDHGRIAVPLLLGLSDGPGALDGRTTLARWSERYAPGRPRPSGDGPHERPALGERCRSWCLVADAPLSSRAFRDWAQRLSPAIVRGGGVVYLREEPQHRHYFHLFGAHWRLERGIPWNGDPPATRVLLAGTGGTSRPAAQRIHRPGPASHALAQSGAAR